MDEKSIELSEIRFLPCSGSQSTAPSPAFQAPSPVGRGKRAAFTLAEVLITLGIIGVVAAMTMPTLMAKYQEKQRVTQLKNAYSILSQAYQMVVSEHGDINQWDIKDTTTGETDEAGNQIYDRSGQKLVRSYFIKHMKHTDQKEFPYKKIVSLSGFEKDFTVHEGEDPIFLSNGTIIIFGYTKPSSKVNKLDIRVILPEKTLQEGVSTFYFGINDKGVYPLGVEGAKEHSFEDHCDRKDAKGYTYGQGRGCAAWVIYNENMDYLHCDGLSWTGKKTCK